MKKIAFLFPGQGAQLVGMGHDFFREYPEARMVFEEADDLLRKKLSTLIFEGTEEELKRTDISQVALFTTSMAMLKVLETRIHNHIPFVALGLSLGEYSALVAAKKLTFEEGLLLVEQRGIAMERACRRFPGTMCVILGLSDEAVKEACEKTGPDVIAANFNCPQQVVISGHQEAVQRASQYCLENGAKRVVPLEVDGAFHSPLMKEAESTLQPLVEALHIKKSPIHFISNVTGDFEDAEETIKGLLIRQLTSPVLWNKSIHTCMDAGITAYVEIGPGKTLKRLNMRIHTQETLSINKAEDLKSIEQELS